MSLVNIGGLPWFNQAGYNAMFMEAYDKAVSKASHLLDVYKELYDEEKTTDVTIYNSYMSAPPSMRPMKASHPYTAYTEQGRSVTKLPYKAEWSLDRVQLESTRGQQLFQRAINGLAAKAARFKANLIMDLIMNNAICHDGLTFFNAAHVFENSGNQSNTATTAFAAGAGYVAELPNMMAIADSQGESIGTEPNIVLSSLALIPAVRLYFNPNMIEWMKSGTATGQWHIGPETRVAPIMATQNNATPSATQWFMFQTETGVKPFIIFETAPPTIEVTSQDADLWKRDGIAMVMAKWTGVADYGPWFLAYRANT